MALDMRIAEAMNSFDPISLEETRTVRLMNRMDTKYIFGVDLLDQVLERAVSDYRIQEVDGERDAPYQTVYLDTPECAMYLAHQNGHRTREKIRVRTYVASHLTFLEVKNKNNKGRTDKRRIQVDEPGEWPLDTADTFLSRYAWYRLPQLLPQLENRFRRITLVNKEMTERLTIDTNIRFHNLRNGNSKTLPAIVVMEVKRDGYTLSSPIRKILNDLRIRPCGFSKYCIGCALTDNKLKQNRFKKRIHRIGKLEGRAVSL